MSEKNLFTRRLREFGLAEIRKPGSHTRVELAKAFLAKEPELAAAYLESIVLQKVADLLREMCDEPASFGQLDLFDGLPVAVTVADGVVKATENCTLDDLGAGLEYRQVNLKRAQEKLRRYEYSMTAFQELRHREDETVGEVAARLRQQAERGGGQEEVA